MSFQQSVKVKEILNFHSWLDLRELLLVFIQPFYQESLFIRKMKSHDEFPYGKQKVNCSISELFLWLSLIQAHS